MRAEATSIRRGLQDLAERLGDLSLELLHEALADADPKASPAANEERRVTRARRSVEKAIALLGDDEDELDLP